jgi:methylated-DNA-protein-cysteine methyltransferase-like protein
MTTFDKVYAAVRLIPRGSVATYGQIAAAIGNKRLARVVGYALHVNPEPGVIPCHRVVKRDGEVSSAFAFGGANRQVELLKAEGVGFLDDSHVDMKHCCVCALPLILEE